MIDRKQKYPEELDAPALMVCAINTNNGIGWKNITAQDILFRNFCERAQDSEEFFDCIENNTYSFEEVITNAKDSKSNDIHNESSWKIGFGVLAIGRCYIQNLQVGAIGYSGKSLHL